MCRGEDLGAALLNLKTQTVGYINPFSSQYSRITNKNNNKNRRPAKSNKVANFRTSFPREVLFRTRLGFYYQNTSSGPILVLINPYDSIDFVARFQTFRSYRVLGWHASIALQETGTAVDLTPYAILAPFYQAQVEVSSAAIVPPTSFARAAEVPQNKMVAVRYQNSRNMTRFSWMARDINNLTWLPVSVASVSDAYYNTGIYGFSDAAVAYQVTGWFDIELKDLQIV